MHYEPPIADYRFLLNRVLGFDSAMQEIGQDIDADLAMALLTEGGRVAADRLFPLNSIGDEQGCSLHAGNVITPKGFPEAYKEFAEAGWASVSGAPEDGGQGLPIMLQLWLDEMVAAANVSFSLFPGLTRGACEAIAEHASDDLKSIWLGPLVRGEWTGVMALTESGAGSDLGLLKTKATMRSDGSFEITGTKIFISSGDHDFGGNIVHLVLARMADAPPGVKGISLFLVPKFLPDESGAYSVANGVSVGALEKKMGIHAQPTCVMNYEDSVGWLVGEPNRGLHAMFTMMNAERLAIGVQGLGIASVAYQRAVAYAQERLQGRSADGKRSPVPIIEHADVRRMLLSIRAFVEAGRALLGWTALHLDRSRAHPIASERARSDSLVALLTPVVKAAFTDFGFESAVQAQQVFGGHGYVRETGVEQYVRDARIAQIYEGTNGIQALDLVIRKLPLQNGAVASEFFDLMEADICGGGDLEIAKASLEALNLLRDATSFLIEADSEVAGVAAVAYLRLFALVAFGWMWTRMAIATMDDDPASHSKPVIATFFAQHILPQTKSLADSIKAGCTSVMALSADAF